MRKTIQMLILLTSSILLAQSPWSISKPADETSKFKTYTGSIYASNSYEQSSVIDEKSGTYDADLRYNVHNDALEYKNGSKMYQVIKTPTIHVRIQDDYYYYCDFKTQRGLKKKGYFILVELNDLYRIYKKQELKITEPQEMDTMTGSAVTGKIKTITKFYVEENGVIMELPMNKRAMLSTFSDKEKELKMYMKKEKIKLRKEEDLIRFVAKYNALKNIDANPSRSLLSNTVQNN
ncbi:hypothetical protein [Aquimarina sp. 2201CG5-10]|uniref:hypothetical protein n=1 Tax=Aquimarina callyspongiae TaxID=3098150 RepID=UPI002AB39274|nr:hypothetical protein [Aquimarina sp. 2201CG5-10]MDY8136684.1 hypothetical protein [Aquimarina sp. 2201CG5-10]